MILTPAYRKRERYSDSLRTLSNITVAAHPTQYAKLGHGSWSAARCHASKDATCRSTAQYAAAERNGISYHREKEQPAPWWDEPPREGGKASTSPVLQWCRWTDERVLSSLIVHSRGLNQLLVICIGRFATLWRSRKGLDRPHVCRYTLLEAHH